MKVRNVKDWVVLLVDDTPDNLIVAETTLNYHGAAVYTASSGSEALRLLNDIQPTVILLDIRMPGMDGWKVFENLRANPQTASIPVIAVTAYAMDRDRDEVLARGFDGYIAKPFDVMAFIDTIGDILDERVDCQPADQQQGAQTL
ncbi:response regulator [bacterium]|nr:response regulator [bacterium]